MNEYALEYNYNCKYCSTKSTLQNLHENFIASLGMNLLSNIIVSILMLFSKIFLPIYVNENGVTFLLIIVSIVHQTF